MHFDQHVAVPDPAAGPEVYRQHARAWLRANLPDFMRGDSLDWRAPTLAESSAWEAAMYQAGLAGMTWPKQYGGHGLSLREHLAVNKEVGALPMPESVSSIGKELAGPIIMAVGTEEQKQAFLPNILSMKQYWCQASPSRMPAPTSPGCAPRPCRKAASGASMARKSGPAARPRRTIACCSRAPAPWPTSIAGC